MNTYECPRIEDAAGYVLRALADGEWESYRYHVAECEDCSAKVQELGFVSHALLSAVPQLSAPPDIRNRVMSVVRAEAELLNATGATADRPPPAKRRRWGIAAWSPLTAGALAAALLVVGLGAGAFLSSGPDSCTTRVATIDPSVGSDARGELKVCEGGARLALSGMQAPPNGRIYELWLDDPADAAGPKPAGLFSVRNGEASLDVGVLEGKQTVLVTDEALPNGSEAPTRAPVVTAST